MKVEEDDGMEGNARHGTVKCIASRFLMHSAVQNSALRVPVSKHLAVSSQLKSKPES